MEVKIVMECPIEQTVFGEVKIMVPEVFEDDRGFFVEAYRSDQFEKLGLPTDFVQDNHS